jgi:uncharacterized protein YbjT (DUF2867 family)
MTVLLLGGTGTLGRRLIPLLAGDGLAVRVLARRLPLDGDGLPRTGVEYVAGDVRDGAALARAMDGADTVISAVTGFAGREPLGSRVVDRDGNLRAIEAAAGSGVDHFVLLSIHEAGPDHPTGLNRDKWAAEQALRAADGLSWSIIRPTPFLEPWLHIVGDPLVGSGTTRIFGAGQNPINFVSAADVARFARLAVTDPALRGVVTEVPGPENVTLHELVALVSTVGGRDLRVRHVPRVGLRVARLVTRLVDPRISALVAAALVMDTRDMRVDGPALRAAFPSIPMTTAAQVAQGMFGLAPGTDQESGSVSPVGKRPAA